MAGAMNQNKFDSWYNVKSEFLGDSRKPRWVYDHAPYVVHGSPQWTKLELICYNKPNNLCPERRKMTPHFETESSEDAGEPGDHGFEHASDGSKAEAAHKRAKAWAEEHKVTIYEYQDFTGLPCSGFPNTYPLNKSLKITTGQSLEVKNPGV